MHERVTSTRNLIPPKQASSINVVEGWDALSRLLQGFIDDFSNGRRMPRIALDGYVGTDWTRIRKELHGLRCGGEKALFLDTASCLRDERRIARLAGRSLPDGEPIFGRVFDGTLSSFYDASRLRGLADGIRSASRALVVCCGPGAALPELRGLFDCILYFDLTRQEVLRRNRSWTRRKSRTQSISPRRIYYVDFPVHDRHRARTLRRARFYVDGNDPACPRTLDRAGLSSLVDGLASMPFRVKPLYEPGVWGGQWLKERRSLPDGMVNCAYGYEIIAPEQSVTASVKGIDVDLPFTLLLASAGRRLMGEAAHHRFRGQFPIRVSYDDTWKGGDLSVQVHPPTRYMRSAFGEGLPQAEMYYLFAAQPGSRVKLGLRDCVDPAGFRRAAEESESRGTRFDYLAHVNTVPARVGDILLIPPGTVHGAGANELVLEIGSTPYRYTFKIYDYRRPDLDGGFRPLSLDHAFSVVRFERTERWVRRHLMPAPRLLRSGKGWRELVLTDSRLFHHVVHRIEFTSSYADDTADTFHILTLVEGEGVAVIPRGGAPRPITLSETILLPRAVGAYRVENRGTRPCKVVKAQPRMGRR